MQTDSSNVWVWIIDTNVVVASVLAANTSLPVAGLIGDMLAAAFPFVLSEALVAEYHDVLLRPALCKRHGRSPHEIESLLAALIRHATMVTPVAAKLAPDPGDQHLWELLAAWPESVLVTEDKLLLANSVMRKRVISTQRFLDLK